MSPRKLAITAAAAAAGAYLQVERHDRAALIGDPAHEQLGRSLAPDVLFLGAGTGRKLAVDLYGPEDAPVVVLLHGWVCSARFWTRQIQPLRADHRVIAYDMRGHGRSDAAADGDYSIEALADDLERVVGECVPQGRSFVLAGHSLGAMTIVAWAHRHRASAERLAAAALINTGIGELIADARVAPLPPRLAALQAILGKAFLTAPGRTPAGPGPFSRRAVRYVALGRSASPAEVAFCEEMVLGCAALARAGCGRTLAGLDLWWSLPSLAAPTAVLVGERDRLTPPAHGRRIAADLPAALGVIELSGCGHMGPVEAPTRVTSVIRGLARGYLRPQVATEPVPAVDVATAS